MPVPDHRLAICRRCRWPSRIARGADTDDVLLAHAREKAAEAPQPVHCRLSQCLNCCDGGHTVRVELRGYEVALVGIRTRAELDRVLENIDAIGNGDVPASLHKRVWQLWRDNRMIWHRNDHARQTRTDLGPVADVPHPIAQVLSKLPVLADDEAPQTVADAVADPTE